MALSDIAVQHVLYTVASFMQLSLEAILSLFPAPMLVKSTLLYPFPFTPSGCHLFAVSQSGDSELKLAVAVGRKVILLRWKHSVTESTWSVANDKNVADGFESIQVCYATSSPSSSFSSSPSPLSSSSFPPLFEWSAHPLKNFFQCPTFIFSLQLSQLILEKSHSNFYISSSSSIEINYIKQTTEWQKKVVFKKPDWGEAFFSWTRLRDYIGHLHVIIKGDLNVIILISSWPCKAISRSSSS